MDVLLWGVLPYLMLATLVGGTIWRYRYDQFGWTTRSSQLYESRLLRIGSPLFHFGMLAAVGGHILGLVIPQSWTDALGISRELYHAIALAGGIPAGLAALAGLIILVYRRRTTGPVFSATTVNDKAMYLVLGLTIVLGVWNTLGGSMFGLAGQAHFNYRDSVAPWFRSVFYFSPDPQLMAQAPLNFQLHALFACLLFAMWPFTRLVHVWSAPVGYLTRPYVVYRSRDVRPGSGTGSRAPQRGWERPELQRK